MALFLRMRIHYINLSSQRASLSFRLFRSYQQETLSSLSILNSGPFGSGKCHTAYNLIFQESNIEQGLRNSLRKGGRGGDRAILLWHFVPPYLLFLQWNGNSPGSPLMFESRKLLNPEIHLTISFECHALSAGAAAIKPAAIKIYITLFTSTIIHLLISISHSVWRSASAWLIHHSPVLMSHIYFVLTQKSWNKLPRLRAAGAPASTNRQ